MADLMKEAKIKRRNAKAALTRTGKPLRYLIESKRTGWEVRDFLSKVQEAYEALVVKHEEFTEPEAYDLGHMLLTELIEDDIEFQEQEAWLTESQDMFMRLEMDAKLYLESTEDLEKQFQVKENRPSDNENSKNLSSSELSKAQFRRRASAVLLSNLIPEFSSARQKHDV